MRNGIRDEIHPHFSSSIHILRPNILTHEVNVCPEHELVVAFGFMIAHLRKEFMSPVVGSGCGGSNGVLTHLRIV